MPMLNSNGAFNQDIHLANKFTELVKEKNLDTVIETGTYHGVTTEWFANNFSKVYTVECNETYYNEALSRISRYQNVNHYLMDSPIFLEKILTYIDENKTIIFLDAHWYTNPVLKELEAIQRSGKKPILAIHDFKVPNKPDFGYDIYPEQGIVYEWKWIESHIRSIYGDNFEIFYNEEAVGAKRGCIFIKPKK
jgi:cephalosporin hydroxylase